MAAAADVTQGLGFATALVRLSHLVEHVFADVARAHGLPPQQLQLLCMLLDGPVGMTALGQLLHLERPGTSGLVDRVEKRGLASRVADPADRRACLVSLGEEGRRVAIAAHDEVIARLESMASSLDAGERASVASATTRILAERGPAWASGR